DGVVGENERAVGGVHGFAPTPTHTPPRPRYARQKTPKKTEKTKKNNSDPRKKKNKPPNPKNNITMLG
ncbi:hypothetical protein, partial [Enterobacter sichuanensis]